MTDFHATYADRKGKIFEATHHGVVCCSAQHFVLPGDEEMITLPEGSKFFTLPDHEPLGWNPNFGVRVLLSKGKIDLSAVSAFPPPGYTRLLLPGTYYHSGHGILPLWAYTALAWKDNQFWIPAVKVDDNSHWDPEKFDDRELPERIEIKMDRLHGNRLVQQLAICAQEYHCFAAKNFFLERWECPVPCSPECNADCVGCISFQHSDKCTASMERLKFIPTDEEVSALSIDHFEHAQDPLISFGQGCEGEPLMQIDMLERAVQKIKHAVPDGTININTNGSCPESVKRLCEAGLDSIRISLNSAREECYTHYFRPRNYTFTDVLKSIKTATDAGIFVNINLLVFPGITDQEAEVEALNNLVRDYGVDFIQMRNLNIDPHYYLETVGYPESPGIGILKMMDLLKREIPGIRFGYFNRTKTEF